MENVTARLRELLDEADKLLEAAARNPVKEGLKEGAQETLHRARDHLGRAYDELRGHAQALDRTVRENPWKAIAATGLIAFVLGMLVRRR